ncbi:MAG TPA: hypothetical protein VID69_00065 [Actinomycetota bacterium]|jgi:hypothetical protein
MDGGRSPEPSARTGLLICSLALVVLVSIAAGWVVIAVPAALAVLGMAAVVVGVDSRVPGDWKRPGPR